MMKISSFNRLFFPVLLAVSLFIGCSAQTGLRQDYQQKTPPVKAGQFDNGKMWTFDYPPMEYFAKTYGFNPTQEWFEKARLSALRLPGCTGSFVSEDGLVMTNHHCARGAIDKVNKDGENLPDEGFYAPTMADERKIPDYYVDQLVLIEDVTPQVQAAFNSGKTEQEKLRNREAKIKEIEKTYSDEKKLVCNVITFYNGGKYSLYGYKRYNDVRLVFAPETQMGFYGGDYDNFTYPRYDLDCSFYRVYDDNGNPLNTKNFFKWNKDGASEGDFVMVLGNPGRTSRLSTYAQFEFMRDVTYPYTLNYLNGMVDLYSKYLEEHPDQRLKYQTTLFGMANSQKAYKGMLGGLLNPVIMGKKYDFEQNFKKSVLNNPDLKSKYGNLWEEIEDLQKEKSFFRELNGLSSSGRASALYFRMANSLVEYAKQMQMPADKRMPKYKEPKIDDLKSQLYPKDLNEALEKELLVFNLKSRAELLGNNNEAFNELLGGLTPAVAADKLSKMTVFADKEKAKAIYDLSPEKILNYGDPFIKFVAKIYDRHSDLRTKMMEISEKEGARVQLLGRALFDVYGTSIPPDATFTLRMADGIVKGYEYNGTIAPPVTTFYGLYDRFHSFKGYKEYDLPERWKNRPADFDLSKPFNFVMTSDIIGGNSGSAVVNKNLEVVGLIFDGNIESLPSDVIYDDTNFRAVAVHSSGMTEALKVVYKADRLVNELLTGKIVR